MSLIPWRSRDEETLSPVLRSFDQLFEDLLENFWEPQRFSRSMARILRPAMDVAENENAYMIRIDLPGMKPEDVNIELEGDLLTISGEMGDTVEKEGDRYHYRERHYGSFKRSLRLPNIIDTEQADAKFENGVLTLTLPKRPEARPKRISIHAQNGGSKK